MAVAENPSKKPLTGTLTYVDRVQSGVLLRFNLLYWGTEYHKIEGEECYMRYVDSLSWYLLFTRGKEYFTITLVANKYKTIIQGFVVYQFEGDSRRHSTPVAASMFGERTYKIEFPSSLIQNEENIMLKKKGYIVFGFMFDAKRLLSTQVCLHLEERDDKFSLIKAQKRRLFTDFIIRADGNTFHVHKAVLMARSKYFERNMHQKEDEIALNATTNTVHILIHYLYSGELPVVALYELLDVYELAVELFVTSLVNQITLYFCDIMTVDNAVWIRNVAVRTRVESLVKFADEICCSAQ